MRVLPLAVGVGAALVQPPAEDWEDSRSPRDSPSWSRLSYDWVSYPLLRSLRAAPTRRRRSALWRRRSGWSVPGWRHHSRIRRCRSPRAATGATLRAACAKASACTGRFRARGSLLSATGGVRHAGSDAESMAAIAVALGVARARHGAWRTSRRTRKARRSTCVASSAASALRQSATSAATCARVIALFRRTGLDPIPAPTRYQAQTNGGFGPADLYPSADGLFMAQLVEREYLGIAWATLRGRI